MKSLLKDQSGSISAISIGLLLGAMFLLVAILEREWLNYTLKMAEETADFAAESGSRYHRVWTTLVVNRLWFVEVADPPVCTVEESTGIESCQYPTHFESRSDQQVLEGWEPELVETWRERAACGDPYPAVPQQYRCASVQVQQRDVRFTAESDPMAQQVFQLNWRPRASVVTRSVYPASRGETRSVTLRVDLEISSLFGIIKWRSNKTIVGRSVVNLSPLRIEP